MRFVAMLLAVALLSSCQAKSNSTASATPTGAATAAAPASSGPHLIADLTNQTEIYSCPNCGMDFDAAGKCSMDSTELVKTDVAYICPADSKPVDHSGSCPRCNVNARVVRTAVAASTPKTGANSGS